MKIVSHTTINPVKREYLRQGVLRLCLEADLSFIEAEDHPADKLKGAEIFLTYRFERDWWLVCNKMKWIHIGGAGVNHIAFPELVNSAVIVTNSRGIHCRTMAEYVLSVMLYFGQQLRLAEEWKRHRQWQKAKQPMTLNSFTLRGKKVGIVGGGAVGAAVRDLCLKMDMCLFVLHRTRRTDTPWNVRNGDFSDLDELMQWADFVVIALPLTQETAGCIDRRRIGLMKPGAILINLARGGLVDETALADALNEKKLAGACLDVFQKEPLPADSPLFDIPNLLITPHISGNYVEYTIDVIDLFLDNLQRYLQGKPLKNVIDWKKGY